MQGWAGGQWGKGGKGARWRDRERKGGGERERERERDSARETDAERDVSTQIRIIFCHIHRCSQPVCFFQRFHSFIVKAMTSFTACDVRTWQRIQRVLAPSPLKLSDLHECQYHQSASTTEVLKSNFQTSVLMHQSATGMRLLHEEIFRHLHDGPGNLPGSELQEQRVHQHGALERTAYDSMCRSRRLMEASMKQTDKFYQKWQTTMQRDLAVVRANNEARQQMVKEEQQMVKEELAEQPSEETKHTRATSDGLEPKPKKNKKKRAQKATQTKAKSSKQTRPKKKNQTRKATLTKATQSQKTKAKLMKAKMRQKKKQTKK